MRARFSLLVLSFFLLGSAARAQDIDLIGNVGWERFGFGVRIHAERIENNRTSGSSGFLRLQIWATTNVYDGVGDITGYAIGTFNLGSLPASGFFLNVSRIVRFHRPPPGLYYTTMTLEEETVDGFVIVDSENFAGIVNFGGYGQGGAHFDNGNGDLSFVGDVSWLAGDRRVDIFSEEILNERVGGRSGVLRVRLWATSTPYTGGILQGFLMATKRVGRLYGQSSVSFSRSAFFWPPPSGEYSVTMTLEELSRGRWDIVDYVTFPGTSVF